MSQFCQSDKVMSHKKLEIIFDSDYSEMGRFMFYILVYLKYMNISVWAVCD